MAIVDYTKAIHLGLPRSHHSGGNPLVVAYSNRGLAYDGIGQYQRAIQDYDEAIQLDPDYAWAYHDRGMAYHRLGQHQRAIPGWKVAWPGAVGIRVRG